MGNFKIDGKKFTFFVRSLSFKDAKKTGENCIIWNESSRSCKFEISI